MDSVSRIFMRARHWQLALIFTALLLLGGMLNIFHSGPALVGLAVFGWFYAIFRRISLGTGRYRNLHILVLSCWVLIIGYLVWVAAFGIFGPVHILSTFAVFFNLVVSAKCLAATEYAGNKKVNFWAALFSLWFFPFGIWYIQPVVNKIEARLSESAVA